MKTSPVGQRLAAAAARKLPFLGTPVGNAAVAGATTLISPASVPGPARGLFVMGRTAARGGLTFAGLSLLRALLDQGKVGTRLPSLATTGATALVGLASTGLQTRLDSGIEGALRKLHIPAPRLVMALGTAAFIFFLTRLENDDRPTAEHPAA